jgi:ComEC/Rec2-related protein
LGERQAAVKRPFLPVVLFYASGIIVARSVALPLAGLFGLAFLLLGVALSCARLRPWLLGPLLALAGAINLECCQRVLSPSDLRRVVAERLESGTVRGRLVATPTLRAAFQNGEETWRALAVIEAEALNVTGDWQPVSGKVAADAPGVLSPEFYAGSTVEVSGLLQRPAGPVAEGLFDYRAYLQGQGIWYRLHTRGTNSWRLARTPTDPPHPPLADRFLAWAQATLARGLPAEDEPLRLLWAMTLGWKTALTDEVAEPFMRTGTMHIFAISGLHIALISLMLVALLRVAQVPRSACGAVVIPLIWFYTAATGWQASAIRSTIMMTVVILGWSLRRPGDLLNSLAASAGIILVWDPRQLFQASFQLSFFVVLSMALLLPPLRQVCERLLQTDPFLPDDLVPQWRRWWLGRARKVMLAFATSLAAWAGSLPLIAWYFHMVTPISLLANLAIVPLSSLALMCNLGSLFCGAWAPAVAELFNHSAWLWMRLMISLSEWAAGLPGAFLYVRAPAFALVVLYYVALVVVATGWPRAPRVRWGLGVAAAVLLAALAGGRWLGRDEVRVTLVPLRGGQALFVDQPGRANDILIDCGDEKSAEFVVKPFLEAQGMGRLPRLLLTHGDVRHVGGASAVTARFLPRHVGTSQSRFRSPSYREFVGELSEQPQRWEQLQAGDTVAGMTVLYPTATNAFPQADDNALVLRGQFGGVRFLLLSDLGRAGQEALLATGQPLQADIVIAGLPTQGEPLGTALLETIVPRLVILADAAFPVRERAPPALRQRLQQSGLAVLCASDTGTLTILARQGRWRIKTMNHASVTPETRQ